MKKNNQTERDSRQGIVIIGEKQSEQLHPVTKELIKAGQILAARSGQSVSVLICSDAAPFSAAKILLPILKEEQPPLILLGSTTFGRILGSSLSASLDAEIIMDASALRYDSDTDRFLITKSSPDGRHLADYTSASIKNREKPRPILVSVRQGVLSVHSSPDTCLAGSSSPDTCLTDSFSPNACLAGTDSFSPNACLAGTDSFSPSAISGPFSLPEPLFRELSVPMEPLCGNDSSGRDSVTLVHRHKRSFSVPISEAKIILAQGRGLPGKEGAALLQKLCEKLHGVSGCSRPCADAGWQEKSHQIGQSGITVHPKFYLAFGISGAVQHMTGVKADRLIAVNNRANAPVFQYSDYGIVGDAENIIRCLLEKL